MRYPLLYKAVKSEDYVCESWFWTHLNKVLNKMSRGKILFSFPSLDLCSKLQRFDRFVGPVQKNWRNCEAGVRTSLTSTFSSEVINFETSSWFGFQSELSLTRLQLPRLCSDNNKQSLVHDRLWIVRHTSIVNCQFFSFDRHKAQMTWVALHRSSVRSHSKHNIQQS